MRFILTILLLFITMISEAQKSKRIVEQSIKNNTIRTTKYNRVSIKKYVESDDFFQLLKYVNFNVKFYDYGSEFLLFGDTVVVDCKSVSIREEIVFGLPRMYVSSFDYVSLEKFKIDVLEKNEKLKKIHEDQLAEQQRIKNLQLEKDEAIKKRQHDLELGIYTGDLVNEKYEGIGKLEFLLDGKLSVYQGNFSNGKFHGKGKLVIQNENWQSYNQYNETYTGEFKFGVFEGEGKLIRQGGNSVTVTYNGSFKSGLYNGRGRLEIVKLAKQFHSSIPQEVQFKEIYVGGFKEGMVDGYGEYTLVSSLKSPAQNVLFVGDFKADREICSSMEGPFDMGMKDFWWIDGRLEKTYNMGTKDEWVYKGDCKKGQFNGFGRILKKMSFGAVCNGTTAKRSSESEWSGTFSNGFKNGEFTFQGSYGSYNNRSYSYRYDKLVYRNDTLIVSGKLVQDELQDLACAMYDDEKRMTDSYSDCITLNSNEYAQFGVKYVGGRIVYGDWKESSLFNDENQEVQFITKGGAKYTGYVYKNSNRYYIKSSKGDGQIAYYKDYSVALKALYIELRCFTFTSEGKLF